MLFTLPLIRLYHWWAGFVVWDPCEEFFWNGNRTDLGSVETRRAEIKNNNAYSIQRFFWFCAVYISQSKKRKAFNTSRQHIYVSGHFLEEFTTAIVGKECLKINTSLDREYFLSFQFEFSNSSIAVIMNLNGSHKYDKFWVNPDD